MWELLEATLRNEQGQSEEAKELFLKAKEVQIV